MLMDSLDAASGRFEVDTKAPPNSIANIRRFFGHHLSEIFGPFARQALRLESVSISKAPSDRGPTKARPDGESEHRQ